MACLAAVADGEDDDLLAVVAVAGDVAALAELDGSFTKLGGQLVDDAADLGVSREKPGSCLNRLGSAPRGLAALI